ncbi:hypothetical protein QYF36_024334 [Acer negundo]|nr:hypothetical protein QYF36_024334 [Acer negundo]
MDGKMVIERRSRAVNRSSKEVTSFYSSSDTESRESVKGILGIQKGECSKSTTIRRKTNLDGNKDGPIIQSPTDYGDSSSSESSKELIILTEGCENEVFSDPLEGPAQGGRRSDCGERSGVSELVSGTRDRCEQDSGLKQDK